MNINKELTNLIVDENNSIRKALNLIQKNGYGACFVNSKNRFKTVITDGDIRKLVIKNKNLNFPIKKYFSNKKSFSLNINSSSLKIYKSLNNKVKIIPLLDESKKIVNFSTLKRLKKINLYDINLEGNEFNYVSECLKTNWISSIGKYVKQFEKKFSEFFDYKYCLTTSSGTTALHLALEILNLNKGDEVILPNLTFASPINVIIKSGAKPVLVDINKLTYNIDLEQIKKKINKKTKAIICVHLYGQPCELGSLKRICKKNKIFLIEDCAEALGSKYKKNFVGNYGDISTFSFYGNKTITTGEGGMLVTSNRKFFEKGKILRAHGMSEKKRYWHDEIGFNYRMTNLQAAVGLAQIENAKKIIEKKILIAKFYSREIDLLPKKIKNLIIKPYKIKNTLNSFWLYNILIKGIDFDTRNIILQKLEQRGINCRSFFYPLSDMKIYKKYAKSSFKNSNLISRTGICLPSSPNLDRKQIKYIISSLGDVINDTL